jgi:deoxyribonuclease-4
VRSLVEASRGLCTTGLTVLLENMAGAGAALGSRFEELASMRDHARHFTDLRVGFCIDTCHCLAAGFDIAGAEGLRSTVAALDSVLGLDNIPVIHANDSKTPLGSRLDRHENVGRGHIGEEGFRRILTHPKLRNKAFILETPHDAPGEDVMNLEALRRLAKRA